EQTEREIVQLACSLATGADRRVLSPLTRAMRELTENHQRRLDLSCAILYAVRHESGRWWEAFVEGHLRALNALARDAAGDDRTRLMAWARFVRKFVRLGTTFTHHRTGLRELADLNEVSGRLFDALVYRARLSHQRYDLAWEHRVGGEVFDLHVVDCGPGRS